VASKHPRLQSDIEALRRRHRTKDLRLSEIARRSGLHAQTITRWIGGDHLPTLASGEKFGRLLTALGATPEEVDAFQRTYGLQQQQTDSRRELGSDDEVVFVIESPTSGRWLVAEWLDQSHFRYLLEDGSSSRFDPAFGPDGSILLTSMAYDDPTYHLGIWKRIGTRLALERTVDMQHATHGQFSPDGAAICCHAGTDTMRITRAIFRYDLSTGTTKQLTTDVHIDNWPTWHPDDSYIVFQREDELWAVDREGKQTWCLIGRARTNGFALWSPHGQPTAAGAPDGRSLVYCQARGGGQDDICCQDLRTDEIAVLVRKPGVHYRDPCVL
jgi:transcriptional regulator with XRE-family HTH domain